MGHTSCCGSGAQGLGKKWSEVLCETFSTEPQLSRTLGPAVNAQWFLCAPGCRSGPPAARLCCGCAQALAKRPGDTMAGVLPCHWKQVGAFLPWEGQHQRYGQTLQAECKGLMFLLATASLCWPSEDGSGLFLTNEA